MHADCHVVMSEVALVMVWFVEKVLRLAGHSGGLHAILIRELILVIKK